jgi:tetratricopeptide (TPR) repeat protein
MIGCGPTKEVIEARRGVDSYLSGNFPRAVQTLAPLSDTPDENYVLNNLRLGAAALAMHDFDEAERAYFRAYQILNATRVNDAGRELRATWLLESNKVWRGEPYERAIANLQLGMVYYARRDYDNARGAFENALFKLRDYADPKNEQYVEYESNFAVALLMLGRCWTQLNNLAEARRYFDQASQLRPETARLAAQLADRSNNVLLYVEFGFGPRKIDRGMDGNALDFWPKPQQAGAIPSPRVTVNGTPVSLDGADVPLFDSTAMALDRRWQTLDTVRKTKSYLGTGLLVAGAGATIYGADRRDQGTALVGLGLMAAGALLKASSAADLRVWEMAPRTAFVIPLNLPPGKHDVTIAFSDRLYQTWRGVDVPERDLLNHDTTYLFRMLRWTSGEHTWPPGSDQPTARVGHQLLQHIE